MIRVRVVACLCAVMLAAHPARAQLRVDINQGQAAPLPVAVPGFASPNVARTAAGMTDILAREVAAIIGSDLKSSGLFRQVGSTAPVTLADVTAPSFAAWRTAEAQALVTGFVQANADGSITVGCYLYDAFAEQELVREGFRVNPAGWRRAAHKCADRVYSRLTGEGGYFDSQIVYIAETGPKTNRVKRLAIMDQDGAAHRFLTNGQSLVLTPRFAPNDSRIAYMSFANNRPRVYIHDASTGRHSLLGEFEGTTLSPRFSTDGRYLLFSMIRAGVANIYRMDLGSRGVTRLTDGPSIDTSPSFAPDGSTIVFESDRSGTQQLYLMDANGGNPRRLTFGDGRFATPAWSPRGDLIAFTRLGGGLIRIGVMRPDGSGVRMLTNSWQDEAPSWSPNGRVIVFFRTPQGGGLPKLMSIDLTGGNLREIGTPFGGSDPGWGPLRP